MNKARLSAQLTALEKAQGRLAADADEDRLADFCIATKEVRSLSKPWCGKRSLTSGGTCSLAR